MGQRQGVIAHSVPQRFGEHTQIKASAAGLLQLPLQSRRVTHAQQTARDHAPVKAPRLAGDVRGVTGNQ